MLIVSDTDINKFHKNFSKPMKTSDHFICDLQALVEANRLARPIAVDAKELSIFTWLDGPQPQLTTRF